MLQQLMPARLPTASESGCHQQQHAGAGWIDATNDDVRTDDFRLLCGVVGEMVTWLNWGGDGGGSGNSCTTLHSSDVHCYLVLRLS